MKSLVTSDTFFFFLFWEQYFSTGKTIRRDSASLVHHLWDESIGSLDVCLLWVGFYDRSHRQPFLPFVYVLASLTGPLCLKIMSRYPKSPGGSTALPEDRMVWYIFFLTRNCSCVWLLDSQQICLATDKRAQYAEPQWGKPRVTGWLSEKQPLELPPFSVPLLSILTSEAFNILSL